MRGVCEASCKSIRESNLLRDARAALRRIRDGSFGTCEECEQDIHLKRLAAVPWAPLCIKCQEAKDRDSAPTRAPARHEFLNAA